MTTEQIADRRLLCDAARSGPWVLKRNEVWGQLGGGARILIIQGSPGAQAGDLAFIAEARTALPEALDEIERLQAELVTEYQRGSRDGYEIGLSHARSAP